VAELETVAVGLLLAALFQPVPQSGRGTRFGLLGAAASTFVAFALLHGFLVIAIRKTVMRMRRPPAQLMTKLALASALVVLASWLPMTPGFLVFRTLGTLLRVASFFVILGRVASYQSSGSD
jgi:hypothetical protein